MNVPFYIACFLASLIGWVCWAGGVQMMLYNVSDLAKFGLKGSRLAWFVLGWVATMFGLFMSLMGPTLAFHRMAGKIIPMSWWIT